MVVGGGAQAPGNTQAPAQLLGLVGPRQGGNLPRTVAGGRGPGQIRRCENSEFKQEVEEQQSFFPKDKLMVAQNWKGV